MKPQSEGSPTAERLATQQNDPLRQNEGTGETHRVGGYFRKLNFEPSSLDLISELFILNILLNAKIRSVDFFT